MKNVGPITLYLKTGSIETHWHDEECEIILALSGKIRVKNYSYVFDLEENDVIFINKTEVHEIIMLDDEAKCLIVHINKFDYEDIVEEASKIFFLRNPVGTEGEDALPLLRQLIAEIFFEIKYKNSGYIKRVTDIGKNLLILMQDNFNYLYIVKQDFRKDEQYNRIWEAFDYILHHYKEKITLGEISSHIHLSKTYFSHHMRELTGMTFEQWMNAFRLEGAMRLLISTDLSMTSISYESGFSDPKYFVKTFKEYFGISPMEYMETEKRAQEKRTVFEDDASLEDDVFNMKMSAYSLGGADNYHRNEKRDLIRLDISDEITRQTWNKYFHNCLDLGSMNRLLERRNFEELLQEVQRDIGFESFQFSIPDHNDTAFDWNGFYSLVDVLSDYSQSISLVMSINDGQLKKKCCSRYGSEVVSNWRFLTADEETADVEDVQPYAKMYGPLTFAYDVLIRDKKINTQKMFSDSDSLTALGNQSLYNRIGVKTPLYLVNQLMAKLEGEKIMSGERFIVTRKDRDYYVLVWNPPTEVLPLNIPGTMKGEISERTIAFVGKGLDEMIRLNLSEKSYIVKEYIFDTRCFGDYGGIPDHHIASLLTDRNVRELNHSRMLRMRYFYMENSEVTFFNHTEPGFAELMIFKRV